MTALLPSQLLRLAAKGWTEEQWCHGDIRGFDESGRSCSALRVSMAARENGYDALSRSVESARKALRKVIGPSVIDWNDAPGRTFAEVLDAFERAAVLAESEGQ